MVAWTQDGIDGNMNAPDIAMADLTATRIRPPQLIPAASSVGREDFFGRAGVGPLAWQGDTTLLFTAGSDDQAGVRRTDLTDLHRGYLHRMSLRIRPYDPHSPYGNGLYDATTATTRDTVVGVQADRGAPLSRAVAVDSRTGHITDVIATGTRSHSIRSVSGGSRGYVYLAFDGIESIKTPSVEKVYWKGPNDTQGHVLTGLGAPPAQVVAQPSFRESPVTPPAGPGLVVAAMGSHEVRLYRIDKSHAAHFLWSANTPAAGLSPASATLSAGRRPELCVIWTRNGVPSKGRIQCYGYGDPTGRLIYQGEPNAVALRPSGNALLWAAYLKPYNEAPQNLFTAAYRSQVVHVTHIYKTYTYSPHPFTGGGTRWGCGGWVVAAQWVDPRHLVLECTGSDDNPGGIAVEDITPGPHADERPAVSIGGDLVWLLGGVDRDAALALKARSCHQLGAYSCGNRGVAVNLKTGRRTLLFRAGSGAAVTSISGGPGGLLYTTQTVTGPLQAFVRLPGDRTGVPVTHLPGREFFGVVAQP